MTQPTAASPSRTDGFVAALACILFFAVAAFMLPVRHFFDDETTNVHLIQTYGFGQLYHFAQSQDVHPPLSYLFNKLEFVLTGSPHEVLWINAALVGLASGYFVWAGSQLQPNLVAKIGGAVAIGLNPSLLIWGVSLRWYAYWLPLAMTICAILYFRPRSRATAPLVAWLLVVSFYVGYLTLYFAVALAITELLRVRKLPDRRTAAYILTGIACGLPQCYYLVKFHLPQSAAQASHSPLKLLGGAGVGLFLGPAYFPANHLAIFFTLLVVAISVHLIIESVRGGANKGGLTGWVVANPLFTVAFALLALELLSGIAVKERNIALGNVLLAYCIGTGIFQFGRAIATAYAGLLVVFLTLGAKNVATYKNLGKASMNMPVTALMSEIDTQLKQVGRSPQDVYFLTWDDVLTCAADLKGFHVLSPFEKGKEHELDSFNGTIPAGSFVVITRTRKGMWLGKSWSGLSTISVVLTNDLSQRVSSEFGFDPYAGFESKGSGVQFPPYQVELTTGVLNRPFAFKWSSDPHQAEATN